MGEGGAGIGGVGDGEAGEGLVEEADLTGPQAVAARPTVETVGRRLQACRGQRAKADFRAGTRSVRSQVKVPAASSGVRPKWP